MNKKELLALIKLLDDPDEDVFNQIKGKLLSMGEKVIPELEAAWEHCFDGLMQSRIENIIHKIQFEAIVLELNKWAKQENQSLLDGTLLVARYQYPDLDEEKSKKIIQQIRQDIWLELNHNLTALEKVRIINHILFDVHHFSGNTSNYHAPQNSYINNVLESKKGNPLSLSILYAVIAQGLDIPIYGVNLPEHFILAYQNENKSLLPAIKGEDSSVLFYINPFSKGAVFNKKEIDVFLKQLKLEPKPSFYTPCSNLDIVKRLLRNLINSYDKLGYAHKAKELTYMLNSLVKGRP